MAEQEWRSRREAAAYVAGMFDGEGSVLFTRQQPYPKSYVRGIEISNTDPALIAATVAALDLLGIQSSVYGGYERRPDRLPVQKVRIHRRDHLERFLSVVPFRSPAKRTRLTDAVESYQTHYRNISTDTEFVAELRCMWVDEGKSVSEIARHFGCADGSVYRWLRKASIPLRAPEPPPCALLKRVAPEGR